MRALPSPTVQCVIDYILRPGEEIEIRTLGYEANSAKLTMKLLSTSMTTVLPSSSSERTRSYRAHRNAEPWRAMRQRLHGVSDPHVGGHGIPLGVICSMKLRTGTPPSVALAVLRKHKGSPCRDRWFSEEIGSLLLVCRIGNVLPFSLGVEALVDFMPRLAMCKVADGKCGTHSNTRR